MIGEMEVAFRNVLDLVNKVRYLAEAEGLLQLIVGEGCGLGPRG